MPSTTVSIPIVTIIISNLPYSAQEYIIVVLIDGVKNFPWLACNAVKSAHFKSEAQMRGLKM